MKKQKIMKKNIWILIIVIILILVGFIVLRSGVEAPTVPLPSEPEESIAEVPVVPAAPTGPELGADEVSDIESQLEGIDLGDLESEFNQIDEDLNQL